MGHRRTWTSRIGVVALAAAVAGPAVAIEVALNPKDTDGITTNVQEFDDKEILSGFSVWDAAPDTFNVTSGFDGPAPSSWEFGQNFDVTVSFADTLTSPPQAEATGGLAAGVSTDPGTRIRSAILELGLYDSDGFASGSQVSSFTLNETIDLTAQADSAVEAGEGVNRQYNVIQIALANEALSNLFVEGMAVFRLQLGGTALGGPDGNNFPIEGGNFAGLDYAKLLIEAVELPEPAGTALLGLSLLGLGALRRRRAS